MSNDAAELSAIASTLEDMERRVGDIAARYAGTDRDEVLTALYDAERHLRQSTRSLVTAGRQLRG